jgi:hypothetical protein
MNFHVPTSCAFGVAEFRRGVFPRWILILVFGLALLPGSLSAQLLPPNGFYRPTELRASVRAGGKTYKLPLGALRSALLKRGVVPIIDRRMPIQRDKWGRVLQDFGFLGIRGPTLVGGPSELNFRESRVGHSGRTVKPLVVKMKGRYKWVRVTMYLKTRLDSRIVDDRFIMHAPVRITVIGISLKGHIHMEAKRLNPPYDFRPPYRM